MSKEIKRQEMAKMKVIANIPIIIVIHIEPIS